MSLYILVDGVPVVEPDPLKWARWDKTAERTVAFTQIADTAVSTVFLALDHRDLGRGPPVLWETAIFRAEQNPEITRYVSHEDALAGHAAAVARVRAEIV